MQEEIHLLQQRIVGMGISIGSQVFQSYEDFVIWIKTNLPSGRFYQAALAFTLVFFTV
jgi:hypothetical protein